MAFENVNVSSLKNALRSCKSSINYSASQEFINSMASDSYWCSDAKQNENKALNKLINTYYKTLEKMLNEYEVVANKIGEYQRLKSENESLKSANNSLNENLWKSETYEEEVTDASTGKKSKVAKTRLVKDTAVENQINQNKNKIAFNKNVMTDLKNEIKNAV